MKLVLLITLVVFLANEVLSIPLGRQNALLERKDEVKLLKRAKKSKAMEIAERTDQLPLVSNKVFDLQHLAFQGRVSPDELRDALLRIKELHGLSNGLKRHVRYYMDNFKPALGRHYPEIAREFEL